MGDAVIHIGLAVGRDIEAGIDVGHELFVSDAGFAKGGNARGPASRFEVERCEGGDGAAEGVADEDELVRWVGLDSFGELRKDRFACVQPGGVEARVNSAVRALGRVGGWWFFTGGRRLLWGKEVGGGAVIVVAGVRNILLRDGGEVDDGVCNGVSTAEGEDDAWARGRMREGDVAAGVAEKGSGVPSLPS